MCACLCAAGIRLLQSMGWRQGKGVGPAAAADEPQKKGRRWGPEAGVGPDNTPIYALAPKTDPHGLGFDPYKVTTAGLLKRSLTCQCASDITFIDIVHACDSWVLQVGCHP